MFILEIIIGLWRYLMNKIRTNVSKIYTYIHTYMHIYIHAHIDLHTQMKWGDML